MGQGLEPTVLKGRGEWSRWKSVGFRAFPMLLPTALFHNSSNAPFPFSFSNSGGLCALSTGRGAIGHPPSGIWKPWVYNMKKAKWVSRVKTKGETVNRKKRKSFMNDVQKMYTWTGLLLLLKWEQQMSGGKKFQWQDATKAKQKKQDKELMRKILGSKRTLKVNGRWERAERERKPYNSGRLFPKGNHSGLGSNASHFRNDWRLV